jgi:hypothetical protein
MNIFHISRSEGVVSRPINFCGPFAENIGEISLRNKMVGIDFRVFPVAPIATTITFKSFIILSFLFFSLFLILLRLLLLLLLVTSNFDPFLGHGLPVARVSRPLAFMT